MKHSWISQEPEKGWKYQRKCIKCMAIRKEGIRPYVREYIDVEGNVTRKAPQCVEVHQS